MPRRNVSAQPDPLAMALAAAMRWVATDEEPKAAGRPPTGNAPPPARGEAMIAMVAPPVAAPPPALRPAVRDDPGPAPSRDPASATPDATAGGVHIGSVEIQIVPAHEPPPRPAPAVAPRAVVAPLSRGFTSPIGLRQS